MEKVDARDDGDNMTSEHDNDTDRPSGQREDTSDSIDVERFRRG